MAAKRWFQIYQFFSIADPDNPQNALKPLADGSLNVNATVTADIGDFAVANAAPPALVEDADAPASVDLSGNMRTITANGALETGGNLAALLTATLNHGPFSYNNISTNATTVVKSGSGILHGVNINTKGTVASSAVIYDSLTASGPIIATLDTLNLSGWNQFDISFTTGLTIVTTGTVAPNITASYK